MRGRPSASVLAIIGNHLSKVVKAARKAKKEGISIELASGWKMEISPSFTGRGRAFGSVQTFALFKKSGRGFTEVLSDTISQQVENFDQRVASVLRPMALATNKE